MGYSDFCPPIPPRFVSGDDDGLELDVEDENLEA
jgi:hypothetical protein